MNPRVWDYFSKLTKLPTLILLLLPIITNGTPMRRNFAEETELFALPPLFA